MTPESDNSNSDNQDSGPEDEQKVESKIVEKEEETVTFKDLVSFQLKSSYLFNKMLLPES